MRQRAHRALAVLTAGAGVLTAALFVNGFVVPGLLGSAAVAGVVGWAAVAAKRRRPGGPAAAPAGAPRPASAPPDGHIRFTLVVEGLAPDRVAAVWDDLCRPGRPASEDLRLLFRTFTLTEGRRFRFLKGDPTATAAVLTRVLGTAAGVPVRTSLEPAAERTPLWN